MISIQQVENTDVHIETLYQWFHNEWDDVEPIVATKNGKPVPMPITALIRHQNGEEELVGGLVFTRFLSPTNKQQAVWINAIVVKAEYRRRGISSKLIQTAEQAVKALGEPELLAFTHLPELYTKLDWRAVEVEGVNTVLTSSRFIDDALDAK